MPAQSHRSLKWSHSSVPFTINKKINFSKNKKMKTFGLTFSKTRDRDANPNPEPTSHRGGETSGGGENSATLAGPSNVREIITVISDSETDEAPSGEGERKRVLMERPPADDVCPICFEDFDVPCRAPCGHWYCGSCILQYWNFSAALQPCKCPMCSQHITKLMPEASLYCRHQAEVTKVLRNVGDYNRLFVGGISGFMLKFLAIPLYIKRMFWEMLNPDRPGVYLLEMRLIALFLGILYSFIPFDFLQIGHRNIIDLFDYSSFTLSFISYLLGLYLRRRRQRHVRELVDIQAGDD